VALEGLLRPLYGGGRRFTPVFRAALAIAPARRDGPALARRLRLDSERGQDTKKAAPTGAAFSISGVNL